MTRKKRKVRSDKGVKRGQAPVAEVRETRAAQEVTERQAFGGFSDKLQVYNKDPSYFYFWHAERNDDIERALLAGYKFVSRRDAGRELPEALRDKNDRNMTEDGPMRIHGGSGEYGRSYKLVLMRQPMDLHERDMAERAKRADLVDSAIQRLHIDGVDTSKTYGDVSGITTKVGFDADQ